MILLSPYQTLNVILAGGVNTNQLSYVASYVDLNTTTFLAEGTTTGQTNNANEVVILNSPVNGLTRQLKFLSICNLDVANSTVTLQIVTEQLQQGTTTEIGTTTTQVISITLQPGFTLTYINDEGFRVFDGNGVLQSGQSSSTGKFYQTVENNYTPLPQQPNLNFFSGLLAINNTNSFQMSTDVSIANTGVAPGTYGGATFIPVFTVNAKGQLLSVSQVAVVISGGTVTSFSAGNLAPIFSTSVANPTSTPALSFSLTGTNSWQLLGNNTGSNNTAPTYFTPILASNLFSQSVGSVGTVLTSNGPNTAPSWQAPSGSITGSGAQYQVTLWTGTTSIGGLTNGAAGTIFQSNGTGANPSWVSALPNGITATTQAAGDNTGKVATDQFVTTAIANAIAGVNPAVAVLAATTAASDTSAYTYNNGVSGIGATLTGVVNTAFTADGVTFTALGQRVLVKNDTQSPSGAFNGIYYVTQLQTALLAPILTRALDYDQPSDINNTGAIPVVSGTVNGSTSWLLTSTINTVGTDALTFVKFSVNPTTIITTSTAAGGDLAGTYPNPTLKASVNLSGTPTISSTPATGDNSKSIADTAYVDAQAGDFSIQIYQALGSTIKAQTIGTDLTQLTTSAALANQTSYLGAIYLPFAQTLTGVKWYQFTQGSYTANNYNGVGLYTYSGGTLTLVASSTNDGTIWKAAGTGFSNKAFSGTYSAAAGLYFVMALYCESAQTTAPVLGAAASLPNGTAVPGGDFTNSSFLFGFKTAQTSLPSPLTASTVSISTAVVWFGLY